VKDMTATVDRVQQRLCSEAARPKWITENRKHPTIKRKRDAEEWLTNLGWQKRSDDLGEYWLSPDSKDKWEHSLKLAVELQLTAEAKAYLDPVGWKGPTVGSEMYDPMPGRKSWRFCRIGEAVRRQKERDGVTP